MFSLKHIEKWSSLLIVRTLMYFSIALETAIGPNNVFILGFSKLSAISIRPKFAIVNVEFNLFIPAVFTIFLASLSSLCPK